MSERSTTSSSVAGADDRAAGSESRPAGPSAWYSWGSPVGLGIGVLASTGAFVLFAEALATLSSIR